MITFRRHWWLPALACTLGIATRAHAQPTDTCPADLTRDAGPMVQPVIAFGPVTSKRLVPEHEKLLRTDKAFARPVAAAIDSLVALEQKTPGVVPAGFRDELVRAPRDAALRLRMARCELLHPQLEQRGYVDLAAAVLLGASPADIDDDLAGIGQGPGCLHVNSTSSRAAIKACDDAHNAYGKDLPNKISTAELSSEDTVSRGLATLYAQAPPPDYPRRGVAGLLLRLVHRCGASGVCEVNVTDVAASYGSLESKHELSHFDLNDRGSVVVVPDPPALRASKKRCAAATGGWESRIPCASACKDLVFADRVASCTTVCTANCED